MAETLNIERFELAEGERVFLRGASGSGKSTLLSLIGGVLQPSAGRISVGGQALDVLGAAARDRFRADHIGFVFQLFNLPFFARPPRAPEPDGRASTG